MTSWFAGSVEQIINDQKYLCRTEDMTLLLLEADHPLNLNVGEMISGLAEVEETASDLVPYRLSMKGQESLYQRLLRMGRSGALKIAAYGQATVGHDFVSPSMIVSSQIAKDALGLNQDLRVVSTDKAPADDLVSWVQNLAGGLSSTPIAILDLRELYPLSFSQGEDLTVEKAGPLGTEEGVNPPFVAVLSNMLKRVPAGWRSFMQPNLELIAEFLVNSEPVYQHYAASVDFSENKDGSILKQVGDAFVLVQLAGARSMVASAELMTGLGKAGSVGTSFPSDQVMHYFAAAHEMNHALLHSRLSGDVDHLEAAADAFAMLSVAQKFPDRLTELKIIAEQREAALLLGDLDHSTGRACRAAYEYANQLSKAERLGQMSPEAMLEKSVEIAIEESLKEAEKNEIINFRAGLISQIVDLTQLDEQPSEEDYAYFSFPDMAKKAFLIFTKQIFNDPDLQAKMGLKLPELYKDGLRAYGAHFADAEEVMLSPSHKQAHLTAYKLSLEEQISFGGYDQNAVRYMLDLEGEELKDFAELGEYHYALAQEKQSVLDAVSAIYCPALENKGDFDPNLYQGWQDGARPLLSFVAPKASGHGRLETMADLLSQPQDLLKETFFGIVEQELSFLSSLSEPLDLDRQKIVFRKVRRLGLTRQNIAHALLINDKDGSFEAELTQKPALEDMFAQSINSPYNYCTNLQEAHETYQWLASAYVACRREKSNVPQIGRPSPLKNP